MTDLGTLGGTDSSANAINATGWVVGASNTKGSVGYILLRNIINAEYRGVLRKEGLLTRDPRSVERKKYGRPKARKRFQYSKR